MQLRRTAQPAVISLPPPSQLHARANPKRLAPILNFLWVFALAGLAAIAVPQASAQTTCELQDKGFWRHNPNAWPVSSLMLGTNIYNQEQLLTILGMPVSGDASVIVAQQLIPTLLNIANGTNENPVSATIDDANAVIGSNMIPAKIKPNTADGRQMTSDAKILESYNQGLLTQPCGCTEGAPGCGWTNGEMHTFTQENWGDSATAAGSTLQGK